MDKIRVNSFSEWAHTRSYFQNAELQLVTDPIIMNDVELFAEMLKTANHLRHACDEFLVLQMDSVEILGFGEEMAV